MCKGGILLSSGPQWKFDIIQFRNSLMEWSALCQDCLSVNMECLDLRKSCTHWSHWGFSSTSLTQPGCFDQALCDQPERKMSILSWLKCAAELSNYTSLVFSFCFPVNWSSWCDSQSWSNRQWAQQSVLNKLFFSPPSHFIPSHTFNLIIQTAQLYSSRLHATT